ncbi:MAG: hypothetical protein HY680_04920 [Chloroflexi bacterium]|nr:hypothetical protein [Chloroflexota bacterium]
MADWAQVALVIGPAAVTGLTGYFVARQSNHAAERRLKLQLDDVRGREERQRRREARSAPLLAFRAEAATAANLLDQVGSSLNRNRSDLVTFWTKKWDEWAASGGFGSARFQLSDPELINRAYQVHQAFTEAIANSRDTENWDKIASSAGHQVQELQELINKRLEEL